jgi:hypothetical protein
MVGDFLPFEALAGYRLELPGFALSLAGGGALTDAVGIADARAIAGISSGF